MDPILIYKLLTSKVGKIAIMGVLILGAFGGAYWKGSNAGYEKAHRLCEEAFAKAKKDQDAANALVKKEFDRLVAANAQALDQANTDAAAAFAEEETRRQTTEEYLKLRYSQAGKETACTLTDEDLKSLQ